MKLLSALLLPAVLTITQSADAQPRNEKIIKHVRKELVTLPFYDVFDNLAFRVEGGKVTLFGQVVRPTLKSQAENVVKEVEGVSSVQN
ncbi:MAG: BON domain-containing protein, partial [Acidobacteria bacterium]|nr:BON domain-containing protein [Acidobacteriota bacterium]